MYINVNKNVIKTLTAAVNVTCFLRMFLIEQSISSTENELFFNIPFNWYTSHYNIWKYETIKSVQSNKLKMNPTLSRLERKLLMFEYTPCKPFRCFKTIVVCSN